MGKRYEKPAFNSAEHVCNLCRFWMARAIESFLRGKTSYADQTFLLRKGLLEVHRHWCILCQINEGSLSILKMTNYEKTFDWSISDFVQILHCLLSVENYLKFVLVSLFVLKIVKTVYRPIRLYESGNNFPLQIWLADSVNRQIFHTRFCTLLWRKTATQNISCIAVI